MMVCKWHALFCVVTIILSKHRLTFESDGDILKILERQKNYVLKRKCYKRVSGQATITPIASFFGPDLIQINVVETAGVTVEVANESQRFSFLSLLSVTETLSEQRQKSDFCKYENVGLSAALSARQ